MPITIKIYSLNYFTMKKSLLILMVSALLVVKSTNNVQAQCIKQGNHIIEGAYGFPYFWGSFMKAAYSGTAGITGIKFTNTNHILGRYEYLLSDNIGIAAEYSYANSSYKFNDSSGFYTAGVKKQRILGNVVIHFSTTDNLDPYVIIGAGYKMTDFYVTGPGTAYDDVWEPKLMPVAFRAGVGLRYYFNDFIGLRGEVGFGGPVACAGISLKF